MAGQDLLGRAACLITDSQLFQVAVPMAGELGSAALVAAQRIQIALRGVGNISLPSWGMSGPLMKELAYPDLPPPAGQATFGRTTVIDHGLFNSDFSDR